MTKTMLLAGTVAAMALTGCVDTQTGEASNTRTGALAGSLLGAAVGASLDADDQGERLRNAAVGAAVLGGAGALAGGFLDQQARDLRSGFADGRINVINTGEELIVRMPAGILFATDSAQLTPTLRGDLNTLARNLIQYPLSQVTVQGHTDNTGSAEYNLGLSRQRAASVANVLIADGVQPRRVRSVGFGESQPIATNATPEGRQQNRRVQIVIVPNNRN